MPVSWPTPVTSGWSKWPRVRTLLLALGLGTTWYLREETLRAAVTALVNYHYQLPLSQAWGSGTLSSSDGQRFPVSGKNRHARRMPPPLGYGMGVTFYSWSSDQLSQYGTKFVPVTVRDATYVLDADLQQRNGIAHPGAYDGYGWRDRDHLCAV